MLSEVVVEEQQDKSIPVNLFNADVDGNSTYFNIMLRDCNCDALNDSSFLLRCAKIGLEWKIE